VLDALNPVRDGMREKDKTRMMEATGVVRQNLEQYGYRGIGDLFRPHITLSRLEIENDDSLESLGNLTAYDGVFPKIGLFEMGDNGTCVRKIAEFKLENVPEGNV
jgi:hypothetical protein